MNDKVKFYLKATAAVVGAVVAAVAGFYPPESTPEWARLVVIIGGGLTTTLTSLSMQHVAKANKANAEEEKKFYNDPAEGQP